jgi:hypothetical protein
MKVLLFLLFCLRFIYSSRIVLNSEGYKNKHQLQQKYVVTARSYDSPPQQKSRSYRAAFCFLFDDYILLK